MSRKEHDRPDPALIIEGSRRQQPSKRVRGTDYPTTALEELKGRKNHGTEKGSNGDDGDFEMGNVDQSEDSSRALADPTKPAGEACNLDGTLKDASEMEWINSPSSQPASLPPASEPMLDDHESDNEIIPAKRKHLTNASHSRILHLSDDDEVEGEDELPCQQSKKPRQAQVGISSQDGGSQNDGGRSDEETMTVESSHGEKRPEKDSATKDLRLCMMEGTRYDKEKQKDIKGAYCKFCIEVDKLSKNKAWLTGNGTSKHRHLFRQHLNEYYAICKKNNVEPKPPSGWTAPQGWKPPGSTEASASAAPTQRSLNDFTVKVMKPTAVTKQGIKEHLLAIIATCDLPFRFVERAAFRRFILYLNPKLTENDIPRKSTLAESVNKKLEMVDDITRKLIEEIPSKISVVWDGWTTKNRRPYTSVSISYIHSPPEDDTLWTLKNMLIEFNSPNGRHTGEMIGRDLLATLQKYGVESKLGWLVGDAVASNDVAVRHVCREIDPSGEILDPKDVRIRCIDHAMHRGAYHFIKALGIPSLMHKKKTNSAADDEDDIDTSFEIDASPNDADAMLETTIIDFEPGDVIGKLLAFVNQVRMSSEGVRDFLKQACTMHQVQELVLRLWVRTRWGSLSDCFSVTLIVQKGIDYFCLMADENDDLPALTKGKKWSNYRLTSSEWKLIKLVNDCLKVIADRHNELSKETVPTCTKVYPLLEHLLSKWEDLLEIEEYSPVHDALRAGIAGLEKYYRKADDTSAYFVSHVLDPTRKLDYLGAAWEEEYITQGMEKMKKIFLCYREKYSIQSTLQDSTALEPSESVIDDWMDSLSRRNKRRFLEQTQELEEDPYEELKLSGRTDDVRRRRMDAFKFGGLQKLRSAYNDGRLKADLEAIKKYAGDFSFELDDCDSD